MKLTAVLARCDTLAPPKEKIEDLLRYLAEALGSEDVGGFDVLRRNLPVMPMVHGFFVDVVSLVSPYLRSQNRSMAIATLEAIEVIVSQYDKRLSPFSVTRLLNDLLLCPEKDKELYNVSKNLFLRG